ncbi:MAG TPA: FHA domain-containing protein [Polyangiaceae bacterium]|nr:FHA domain-containing protein [Polyangiaceae bacterium]
MQHSLNYRSRSRAVVALASLLVCWFVALSAQASPEAKILRVDPRAAQDNGNPILTTVVEVSQSKRVSDAIAECGALTGNGQLDCMSQNLEKPFALYTPFPFPAANAIFTVTVDGTDVPAKFVSDAAWGDSLQQPGVGTAWLILIDADRRMGKSFTDARQLAQQFVLSMGPNDIVNVMFFNDRQVVKDSKWVTAAQKARAQSVINGTTDTFPSSGRNRSLLTIIKTAATDGFGALGNVGDDVGIPLHQAMIVLSDGFGGADPSTTGPGALQLQQYLSGGRFPEDNTALPKAPVPVISIWYPPGVVDEFRQNSLEFMQNMANTDIGGFFSVMREGGGSRSNSIVSTVRQRFSKMHIVKWKASCVAPSVTQSFKLVFNNVKPPILGDNTFKDVPVGIDPSTWPLDVNIAYTQDMAKSQGGVSPGGTFKVYGDFCWGGDKGRAEVYFLPSGQPLPTALAGTDIDQAKRTQQQLIAMGMKGTSLEASDTFAQFEAPDKDKILAGSGEQAVVRLVVYDNKARRTSGVTAATIIQLKGTTQPLPLLLILSACLALVVIALLIIVIVRSGGKKRGGGGGPPAPVVGGGGYGAPPGGYGGGYGAPPGQGYGSPPGYGGPPRQGASAVSPELMYGGSTPGQVYGGQAPAPQAPPPNPYGPGTSSALLQCSAGVFTVLQGQEMRAGRDAAQCGIALAEPRISAVHATFKLESGQLMLRDEHSNNGTSVNNSRISPGVWAPVPNGSVVRLGPVEFTTRVQ